MNTALRISDKAGNVLSTTSMSSFFSGHGWTVHNQSDPSVLYDSDGTTGNFVVLILDYTRSSKPNYLDWAISHGDPSTGSLTWTFHQYPVGFEASGNSFADYPRAGWNADGYFISFNMFGPSTFKHESTVYIPRNSFSGSFPYTQSDNGTSNFTMTPAVMHGGVSGYEYFVDTGNTGGGGSSIQVLSMSSPYTASTLKSVSVGVAPYTAGGSPQQPSGTIASFDTRIFNAAYSNGHLVAAHQGGLNGASTPVYALWYDVNVSGSGSTLSATLNQQGHPTPATSTTSAFMPSVEIDPNGSIGMDYEESSTTEYWSMYVTERTTSDPLGSMETPVVAGVGGTNTSDSRLGDFSAITVDPVYDTTNNAYHFWAHGEYQLTSSNAWQTYVASFYVTGTGTSATIVTSPHPGTSQQASQTGTSQALSLGSLTGMQGAGDVQTSGQPALQTGTSNQNGEVSSALLLDPRFLG
ncbi:MAG TPA: hypothetical protein VFA18_14075, partial [Gemmataceae bacterium]|nr:hypothetical protein [Gemmataceae bacterium]